MNKNIQRGTGNNCRVLGEGKTDSDFLHVERVTPLQTKIRELQNDPQYAAINQVREKSTSRKRLDKETKPL